MNLDATEIAALKLVQAVGARLRRARRLDYQLKGKSNLVTALDLEAEELLRQGLPQAGFWGEETGRAGSQKWCWVVDPVDGTTNFAHRHPNAAISVALACGDEVRLGIVYDFFRKELFSARSQGGAFLNGRPIRVSRTACLEDSLLSTGFGPESGAHEYEKFQQLTRASHGVRCLGCCSLALCAVACGRLEAYYEWDLNAWDVAAGGLIVREAGGRFTTLSGSPPRLERNGYLASNGLIHEELIA